MEAALPSLPELNFNTAGQPRGWRSQRSSHFAAVLVLLTCATTGCTSFRDYVSNGFKVGPDYRRPPAPVADHWIDANDKRVHSEESPNIANWWTVFRDPVLDELVADAYRQNLTLREAGFRILQARANLGYAIGNFFPQQQYMSGDYMAAVISTEAANRPFVLQRYYNQWDLGFTLAWELDFWGRFRRSIEAADGELNASIENYDDVMVTLLGDIASNYVNVRIYEAQIALTQANIQLQEQTLALATARFRGGLVTELDVDQAQSILSQTQAQIPQLQISLRMATNQLCVLLGIPSEDLRARMKSLPIPTAPSEVAVGIPADLLRRRPDVRRAERQAAAQAARIGVAESDFYPHISITGTLGGQAANLNDLLNSRAMQGGVGPSFQWNLLNYGRIINRVRAEDALFQQLVLRYQQSVLQANREAENGLVTFLRSQEQARFMAESVAAAQRAVTIAIAQYKGGLVDFNRVSLVEQNLVTQQNSYAQAVGAIANGLVQTYRALGGGWEIRLDPQAAMMPGLPPAQALGEPIPPPAPVPNPNTPAPLPGAAPPPLDPNLRVQRAAAAQYLPPQTSAIGWQQNAASRPSHGELPPGALAPAPQIIAPARPVVQQAMPPAITANGTAAAGATPPPWKGQPTTLLTPAPFTQSVPSPGQRVSMALAIPPVGAPAGPVTPAVWGGVTGGTR